MHQHPFWDLVSRYFGAIGSLSVHPASPILLTKNGPLEDLMQVATAMKTAACHAHLEFENKLRRIFPNASNHLLYLTSLKVFCYPERNFGVNQLLDSSMSLSPLYPDLTSDLHVNTASNVHQVFTWLPSAQEKLAIFRVPALEFCFRSFSRERDRTSLQPDRDMPRGSRLSHFHCALLGLSPQHSL